jgi:predicted lipid-binding transport protein (Tim44 family)
MYGQVNQKAAVPYGLKTSLEALFGGQISGLSDWISNNSLILLVIGGIFFYKWITPKVKSSRQRYEAKKTQKALYRGEKYEEKAKKAEKRAKAYEETAEALRRKRGREIGSTTAPALMET